MKYIKQKIKTPMGDYEIEVESEIHDLGIAFKNIKIPKNMCLLSVLEAQTFMLVHNKMFKVYSIYIEQSNKCYARVSALSYLGNYSYFNAESRDVDIYYGFRGVLLRKKKVRKL